MKLEKLQQNALKYITLNGDYSHTQLLQKCDKLPLYVSKLHKCLVLVYQIINNLSPYYLSKGISQTDAVYNMRSEMKLTIPKFKSISYRKKSLCYAAPFYWNILPYYVKNAKYVNV